MDYIERNIEARLSQAAKLFPAVVLAGPRQTGKTTLLRHLFSEYHSVSLDRPLTAEQAEQDAESFLAQRGERLLIDEVQYAPSLLRFLKIAIDEERDKKGRFILTGSQKFSLMKGVSESLAGRVAVFNFEGLSCSEILVTGKISWDPEGITQLILRGGFPELWQDVSRPIDLYLSSYIATYLERDVKQVLAVTNLRDFERFLRACSLRSGQQLNKSDLARDIGVSVPTVSEWLNVLVALGHIVLLEPWFGNLNRRLVKSPKLYLADTALLCALNGVTADTLWTSPLIGPIWETFIFAELRKYILYTGMPARLWYYQDQSQLQVDFIFEQGQDLDLIECKWTSSPTSGSLRNLDKVEAIFEKDSADRIRVRKKLLVSRAPETFCSNGIQYISPASLSEGFAG